MKQATMVTDIYYIRARAYTYFSKTYLSLSNCLFHRQKSHAFLQKSLVLSTKIPGIFVKSPCIFTANTRDNHLKYQGFSAKRAGFMSKVTMTLTQTQRRHIFH